MPRQTRETELPKPPAPPLDWVKIAESGKVWDFIEGEDFTGKVESFRGRKKTEARKAGVDFESTAIEKSGKTVLKVLAFKIDEAGTSGGGKSRDAEGEKPSGETPAASDESAPEDVRDRFAA